MSDDTYCPLCDGDPRRRANVEPHKAHSQAPPKQETPALPGDSEEEWYGT